MKENNLFKFRAWQKYHKTMVEVTSISFDDTGEINGVTTFIENQAPQRINYKEGLLGGFFLKDERGMVLELMQYTGLKDKNDIEIYDGDIVKLTEKTINGGIDTHTCKVFQSKSGAWRLEGHPDFSRKYTTKRELYSVRNRVEIMGNVYEHPELMEVAK